MFETQDIQKYREIKAPATLKARVMADCKATPQKKARVLDMTVRNRRSVKTLSALAACLCLLIGIFSVTYMSGSSVTLSYGGAVIGTGGSSVAEAMPLSIDARSTAPMGISLEVDVKRGREAEITVTGGDLYRMDGEDAVSCGAMATVTEDCVLLWAVDGTEEAYELTVNASGKETVYVLKFSIDAPNGVIYKK